MQKRPRHHHNLWKCKTSLSYGIFIPECGLRLWASSFWIWVGFGGTLLDMRLRGIGYVGDGGAKFTQMDGPLDPLLGADVLPAVFCSSTKQLLQDSPPQPLWNPLHKMDHLPLFQLLSYLEVLEGLIHKEFSQISWGTSSYVL